MKNKRTTKPKTFVVIGKDFNNGIINYRKGQIFDANLVREAGLVIVTGHGSNEVIPHEYLGDYFHEYNEIVEDHNTQIVTKIKENVTELYLNHWKKMAEKAAINESRNRRLNLKAKIAEIRKTINFVKTGKAEKHLKKLLKELQEID